MDGPVVKDFVEIAPGLFLDAQRYFALTKGAGLKHDEVAPFLVRERLTNQKTSKVGKTLKFQHRVFEEK